MNMEKLNEKEQQIFNQLERTTTPPERLKEDVIHKLKQEKLIRDQRTKTRNVVLWLSRAAAVIIFFIGGMAFQQRISEKSLIDPGKGYVLLLHEDENFRPGELSEMVEEYSGWIPNLNAQGIKAQGQELQYSEVFLENANKISHAESIEGEMISGYFIIEANSLEEATQIASTNPHLKYGGKIELRPFMVRE